MSWGRKFRRRPGAKRKPRVKPVAAAMPWHCVVLAVDTATRSGWAIRVAGRAAEFGEADTLDSESLAVIVRWAMRTASRVKLPLVLVLEAPWGGQMPVLMALGAARERWLHVWRAEQQPMSRVVSVVPSTWRSPVLGRGFARLPREEVRPHEQFVASAMVGETVRPDEAAAICISRWAERAAKVGKVIGKHAAAASQRTWTGRVA
jgi:hypothetical protein